MTLWLLHSETLTAIAEARKRCSDPGPALAWERAELEAEARAEVASREGGQLPRGLTIAGSTAEIRVDGVLTKKPDFFAAWFGGGNTTYSSIRNALAVAATDPAVRNVVLAIDSPGGSVDGLFETLDSIASLRALDTKKISVRAENAMSAAYGIAAAAGAIEAVGRGATFGSIGTAVSYYLDPEVVTLTNTDSPDKRPDLKTPEGKAVVVKYLDQVNDELVRAIARGRNTDAKTVAESYGRGAVFTAPNAQKIGMIDRIASTLPRAASKRGKTMGADNEQTDASAATPTAIEIAAGAESRGAKKERDRVLSHLTMGEACGDMSIAIAAIRAGDDLTQELTARYQSAGMNRADRRTRQAETTAAAGAVAGEGESSANATDTGDAIVAHMKNSRSFVRG
jgi:ClpP class serine protease